MAVAERQLHPRVIGQRSEVVVQHRVRIGAGQAQRTVGVRHAEAELRYLVPELRRSYRPRLAPPELDAHA